MSVGTKSVTKDKLIRVEFWGGFHNQLNTITLRISKDSYYDHLNGDRSLFDAMSDAQYKKLDRHLCGIKGCQCPSASGKVESREI